MIQRKRYSPDSLSRWGEGNHLYDDVARQLNGDNRCCEECGASTSLRLLQNGLCPDCDGRAVAITGASYESPFLDETAAEAAKEEK